MICDGCPLPSVRQIVQCGEALRQARAEAQFARSRMETIKSRSRADRIAIVEAFQFGCLNVAAEKFSHWSKSDTDSEVTRCMKSRIGNEVSGSSNQTGGASHEGAIGKNLQIKGIKRRGSELFFLAFVFTRLQQCHCCSRLDSDAIIQARLFRCWEPRAYRVLRRRKAATSGLYTNSRR